MLRRSGWATISILLLVLTLRIAAPRLAVPLLAQGISNQGVSFPGKMATPPTTIPRFPDDRVSIDKGPVPPEQRIEEGCFLPPLTVVHHNLIDAPNLDVPAKASKEYRSACSALRQQKWPDAEQHLRKAVEQHPKYSAAWVTLGQVMQARQQPDGACSACTQAVAVDPTYLPAHLCLADLAARAQDWNQVLKFSQRALELNPASDPHAYFYAASAYLKLNQPAEAEKNALKAAEIDKQNLEPRVHFLLAQIYELKGNSALEVAQLREYLKFVSDPQDAAMVKKYVADLEAKAVK
jgi:tetratricopeptide (TPR) repeat protein